MQTFRYPAAFEPGDEGGFVVTFPDIPEAITDGPDMASARVIAADALGVALLTYAELGRPIPVARALGKGEVLIAPDPEVAAKLAVIEAFKAAEISKTELARRMGKDEREVRRILDPDHGTKLGALTEALAVLGRRLVIGVEAA